MSITLEEGKVQDLVNENSIVQDGIKNALDISGDVLFIAEDTYINGIQVDFTLLQGNTIKAIIECKSGKIGVNEYVRGTGQLLQYEYFAEEKIPHGSYEYAPFSDFKTIYLFPSSVIKNNQFNIAKFKYPETTIILVLNEYNNAVRQIGEKELKDLKGDEDDNLVSVSPYYFRDNRVFELYMLLKYLFIKETTGVKKIDRTDAENTFLKKTNTINNGNWRNAFITLKSLGYINNKNLLTKAGKEAVINSYEDFTVNIFHYYLDPYFKEILECFNNKTEIKMSNKEISNLITNKYGGRDVLYLTQSSGRYISSFMNIMRDDYGIVDFKRGGKIRKLNYNPFELSDEGLKNKIKENSIAYKYLETYQKLIAGGI